MRIITVLFTLILLAACSHITIEPMANPAGDKAKAAEKMKDSSLPDLLQFLAFGEGIEKQEAAYRIGSLAVMRNNEIAQSHLTGTACPDKSEFAPAIAPLAAALRSKEDGLQFEAAATLFAIGPINEEAFNALSEIGASNDKDIVRARNQFINYLFVVPCGKTTPAPAPVMPATTAPTEEPTPAPENTGR